MKCCEDLSVEQFIPELAVERFDISVLPGTARLDEEGSHPESSEPLPYRLCRELGSIV